MTFRAALMHIVIACASEAKSILLDCARARASVVVPGYRCPRKSDLLPLRSALPIKAITAFFTTFKLSEACTIR